MTFETTRISVDVVWSEPEKGTFFPVSTVTGNIPDELDTYDFAQWLNRAVSFYLRTPSNEIQEIFDNTKVTT